MRLGWFGLGAAVMYFADPRHGRRRRAMLRDRAVHLAHREETLLGKAQRDLAHRMRGLVERARRTHDEVPDDILADRVRAAIGRACSHAAAIDIEVDDGRVYVSGPILAAEAGATLRHASEVAAVRCVIDRLERHDEAGRIPELQGNAMPSRRNTAMSPGPRAVVAGAGVMLIGGAVAHGGLTRLALLAAGGAVLARAIANRPLTQVLAPEVRIDKTITIHAPRERVAAVWARVEDFPRFMQHVRKVHRDGDHTQWTVDGPLGSEVRFDADLELRDHELLWRTSPDARIAHRGSVRFERIDDNATRVRIEMRYRPPGGIAGYLISLGFGRDPRHQIDDDLVRMKALLEQGFTRAHHERVLLADLER